MAVKSELFVKTRPVSDVRVRTEAYRIFYTINKMLPPGRILRLEPAVWKELYEPLCDPNRLDGEHECAALHEYLERMPEFVMSGAIKINWSKQPSASVKYTEDEWGKVTRHHNPVANTQDPAKPKPYRSPVRREPRPEVEDWERIYWQPYANEILRGRMKEQDVKAILWREYKRAQREAAGGEELPVRDVRTNKHNLVGNHQIINREATLPIGSEVRPRDTIMVHEGAFVDPSCRGFIRAVTPKHYTIVWRTTRIIDETGFEAKDGPALEHRCYFSDVERCQ